MCKSFKNGFEFVVKYSETTNLLTLRRKNEQACYCPFDSESFCGSHCPHFVIDKCSIVDKKCVLDLTCGKHMLRVVEII